MTNQKIQEEFNQLLKNIEHHDNLYYQQSNPIISDAEYDQLIIKKQLLLKQFPDLQYKDIISNTLDAKFIKIAHHTPMLSLQNIFNQEDLENFLQRIHNFIVNLTNDDLEIVCEPKIDGVSLSLQFIDGILDKGVTRGNGKIGEDVTHNIIDIVPNKLNEPKPPKFLEIRGEIFITREDFAAINVDNKLSNPRNIASGLLRSLPNHYKNNEYKKKLQFIAYSINADNNLHYTQHHELLEKLKKWDFNVIEYEKYFNMAEIISYYQRIYKKREQIPYDIDGVVYKINNLELQKRLSYTGKFPRWAAAHKFPSYRGHTRINKIILQVGKTGCITPVAVLEPINIGGVVIKKASLHNFDLLHKKDIREHDLVIVDRAGDVIPHIIDVVDKNDRSSNSQPFEIHPYCPSCNSYLTKIDDDVALYCENYQNCEAQILARLVHFVSKEAFNIVGLGKKQIQFLFNKNIIHDYKDIFLLPKNNLDCKLENYEGWGKKSVNNLLQEIEAKKNISLEKFLFSLNIKYVGQIAAQKLAEYWKNIENIINLQNLDIHNIEIDGIGHKTLQSFINFLQKNHECLQKLIPMLNIIPFTENINLSGNSLLYKKNIAISGKFNNFSRQELKEILLKNGAIFNSNITSKTNMLIIGQASGSKKKLALEKNIPLIEEDELLTMLKSINEVNN